MGKIVIATPEISDAAVITATGTLAPAMPVGNLSTLQPSERARWTSLSNMAVTLDLNTAKTIRLIFLGAHNGSADARWRIRAATAQNLLTSAPDFDSGLVSMFAASIAEAWAHLNSLFFLLNDPKTLRWWRIDFSDGGNPDGFFEAGRLVLADAWQPSRNMRFGNALGFDDATLIDRTAGGQTFAHERGRPRTLEFSLSFLDKDDMLANAFELDRRRGRARDVVVVPDPDATANLHRETVHGLMAELSPIVNSRFNLFEKRFRIMELL